MDLISEDNYIIAQAKRATDPHTAKAWILSAKTLFPKNFNVQFEAYKIEKAAKNYEEAAKCFSYITLTFQNQPVELWTEVTELTAALRTLEEEVTPQQEFFVKMFEHVSFDVQHKILLLTVNHTESNLEQCRLLLLLLKRFPQTVVTHSAQLVEMIVQGAANISMQEMLVQDVIPMIYHKTPDLPAHLVRSIFTISLEYYVKQMFSEENKGNSQDMWKEIFQTLMLCGKILKWDSFLPYNKSWSKDMYWQKLLQIIGTSASQTPDSHQILFYVVTLFIFSLQEYTLSISPKSEENGGGASDVEVVLVEGFKEWSNEPPQSSHDKVLEPIPISVNAPCTKDTTIAFVTAANCWHFLHSTEFFQHEFSQLLIKLPLSQWISSFIFDLALYVGHFEEAKTLLNDMPIGSIRQYIRILSLIMSQGPLTIPGFECILKILVDLPTIPGHFVENMCSKKRHLVLLPLTRRAVVQYCTRAIITNFSQKIYEPNCPDLVLGNLLVLSQLEYPRETTVAELIFSIINARRQFSYHLFPSYVITIDFIEEFMHIWNTHSGEINFEFMPSQQSNISTRRIGTRGADKGVRDDFKQIIKQQIARSNEDIAMLITQFITKEHLHLVQTIF